MENGNRSTGQRVAIVTGSSKGIGKAIAVQFSRQSISVVVTSRDLSRAQKVVNEIRADGGDAIAVAFDIEDPRQLDALIDQTVSCYGGIDILVNNAISQRCLIPSSGFLDQDVIQILSCNIAHNYLLCKKAFPHLVSKAGCIINIGSVVADHHLLGLPLYGLVKGAINQMTRVLASEWTREKVRVNTINPGFVRTQAFHDLGIDSETIESAYQFYSKYQPLSGTGVPSDVAGAALFLAGESAATITGISLAVDGGFSASALSLYGASDVEHSASKEGGF